MSVSTMGKPPIPDGPTSITASWLRQALSAGVASDLPAIKEVDVEGVGAGVGLMGEVLRCRLTYEDDAPFAPDSVIVKLPSPHPKNLKMSKLLQLYKREYSFYLRLAPHVPIHVAALYYGDFEEKSHRFVLVLEDMRGMETGNRIEGATERQAKVAIRTIARLHGSYWNKVDRPPIAGLHYSLHPKYRPLVQLAYLRCLVPALKNFGDHFSEDMRRLAEAYGPRIADHMADVATQPLTFGHGDFLIDNMFFGPDGSDDFAVIDWQVSGISSGLYDVASFMSDSVSTETRRNIERETLREYHDVLCSAGVKEFSFEACWRLYRQNMLGRLLAPIFVCGGLDLSNERGRALAENGLRKTLAAVEDLEAGEFLPTTRPLYTPANAFSILSRCAYKLYKTVR